MDDCEESNEDWQVLCESSLLKNHLPTFEKICHDEYGGDNSEFLRCYLKPFVMLLDSMRSAVEQHYSQIDSDVAESPWIEKFERIVKFVIHPRILKVALHKGDFYLHLSTTLPRKIQLKFYDSGTKSKTLATDDCIYMCSEDWANNLRKEAKNRFVFSNCIIWSSIGLERKTWQKILYLTSRPAELTSQQSFLREESVEFNEEEKQRLLESLADHPLHILELDFEILHSQVAYLPGTRDKRGGAVIIVKSDDACWENPDLTSTGLANLFMYYFRIPRLEVQKLGCSIVVDVRQGRQIRRILECVGEAIELFQEKLPNAVRMAYVITRKDSLLLMIAAGKIREKLNFEFQLIRNVQNLYQFIPQENLPVEFGGTLIYHHEKWIKFRTHLEPFMTGCRSAAKHAMTSIKELSDVKLGTTIKECRTFLEQHSHIVQRVLEDSRLVNLRDEGKKILERLKEPVEDVLKTLDYIDTVECVHSLYEQMNTLFDTFQKFSLEKTRKLDLQLQYVTFETESKKISKWLDSEGIPFFQSHTEIGDSIGHVASLQAEFSHFEATANEHIEQSMNIIEIGRNVLSSSKLSDSEKPIIAESLEKLENGNDDFTKRIESRKKTLSQAINFHSLYEKASDWSLQCLRYIAQMNMEDLQTLEGTQKLKSELEKFLSVNTALEEKEMARMTELAHHLESEKLKMQAGQISARCAEVEEMILKKSNTIAAAENRLQTADSYASSESSSGVCKDDDLATECGDDTDEAVGPSFSWKNDSGRGYDENDDLIVAFDSLISHKSKERLRYIAEEMVNTEKGYISSLEYILNNYVPEMDKPCLPPTLAGKKNILFGNIGRIYDFHKRYFSQELENYQHSPLQVGKCFLRWERQFYVYAMYNKNKPKSDVLLGDYGNAYFAAKQKELGDKLNLASYLIKPVQRLGKYALLLRDMANCCTPNDPRLQELTAAQDMIKFQLRHGNDLLAMDSVRECDLNLKEQGCLLRQGDFTVWTGKKKHLRRVFLFEDLVLFTKAKKQTVKGDWFFSKNSLKTDDVGLTENIGENGLRFELWYRRWRKSKRTESYVLQASNSEIKKAWVTDIRRLLMNQALRNKEYGRSEITTGISVESQPSGLYAEPSSNSYSSPNTRTKIEPLSKSEPHPNNPNKRLSWISSDSTNTSGVHDLNYNTENESTEDHTPKRTTVSTSHSFTSMRRPALAMHDDNKMITSNKTANALVDMPVRQVRFRNKDNDTSFLRSTLHRRTLHIDSAIDEQYRSQDSYEVRTRLPSPEGRVEKYKPILSAEVLSETEETIDEINEESGSNDVKSRSHSCTDALDAGDATSEPPCSSSASLGDLTNSPPDDGVVGARSSSLSLSSNPAGSAAKEQGTSQMRDKKSKDKNKDKSKKPGRRISLGALMGKKKKTKSTSSVDS